MTLLLGVLAASLVGSVHCAAMCGGFVCLYAGLGAPKQTRSAASHLAYNGGRLISYVTLGLVAGSIGARLDHIGGLASVERGAAVVAGSLMILWAAAMIATSLGFRVPIGAAPEWAKRAIGGALVSMQDQPPTVRAGALGLLTTLLPCGWLYTFVVTAGGTGNPIAGATVMLAFWAGTLPMMVTVGFGVRRIARPIARHLPIASAVLVLTLGALSIAGKLRPLLLPDTVANHTMHTGMAHDRR